MGSEQGLPPWEVIESVSYTPSRKQVRALVAALTSEPDDKRVGALERALLRQPQAAWDSACRTLREPHAEGVAGGKPGRLYKLLGRLLDEQSVGDSATLAEGLRDPREGARRAAARAVGKRWRAPHAERQALERALLDALSIEVSARARASLVEALGRVGGAAAQAALSGEEGEAAEAARLLLRRNQSAASAEAVTAAAVREGVGGDAPLGEPTVWVWRCRRGLEAVVGAQVAAAGFGVTRATAGEGEVFGAAPAEAALGWGWRVRAALGFGVRLGEASASAEGVGGVLGSEGARRLLTRMTPHAEAPEVRYRLTVEGASKGEARTEAAQVVRWLAERAPWLVNDPSRRGWDVTARQRAGSAEGRAEGRAEGSFEVIAWPRMEDPRFGYRQGDVPAASHPTMAAALAAVAKPQAGDVVWDPFAGSGGELVECGLWAAAQALEGAREGAQARAQGVTLLGSDLSEEALSVAARNVAAAGLTATLRAADALTWCPTPRPTLIVTNPPMGRRVKLAQGIEGFFTECLRAFAGCLTPGGRLVWFAPRGRAVARIAQASGWRLLMDQPVDMGGFEVHLQALSRDAAARTRRR